MLAIDPPLFICGGGMVDFRFFTPVDFFEKANAPQGQRRRIGGVISTESRDQEGEVIKQSGLDFQPFLTKGWLNDNHSRATADGVLGYPTDVRQFRKGQRLPNGKTATTNCTWFEGYLLEGWEPADKIWRLGKALQGTGRALGYSVEGKIQRRGGPKTVFKKSADGQGAWVGDTVLAAQVRNVAITNCPVNAETSMEVLAKAFSEANCEKCEATENKAKPKLVLAKMLTVGTGETGSNPMGPRTGAGAGAVLAVEDLERVGDGRDKYRKRKRKGLHSEQFGKADLVPGGKADDKDDDDFDSRQIKMGAKVEREHTKNAKLAHEIARDHLTEIPDYYDRLKRMESQAEKQGVKKSLSVSDAVALVRHQIPNLPVEQAIKFIHTVRRWKQAGEI